MFSQVPDGREITPEDGGAAPGRAAALSGAGCLEHCHSAAPGAAYQHDCERCWMNPIEPGYSRGEIALRSGLFVAIVIVCRQLFLLLVPAGDPLVRSALMSFAGGAVANMILARLFLTGRMSDIGLGWDRQAMRDLLAGLGAGGGGAALMLGIALISGMAALDDQPAPAHATAAAPFLLAAVLAFGSVGEELTFHGYAFQFLIQAMGVFATILPVSALFAVMHLGNQGVTPHALLNTALFGFLLGYAYWRTGALWLSIGIHFGWNLTLPLFGANLSGFTIGMTGYVLRWNAGELWSGGGYGPEGGLLTTLAAAAMFLAVRRVR